MNNMLSKISKSVKIFFYYSIIYNLPHSRYCQLFNTIRKFYICNILKISPRSKFSNFQNKIYLSDFRNISIGSECQINEHVFIQGAQIGSQVMIAPHVTILSSTHQFDDISVPMIRQEKK